MRGLALVLFCTCWIGRADWPQFRGDQGDATVTNQNLPTNWGGVFDVPVWKTDIPGRGWSSPIVVGDRIWLTSALELSMDDKSALEKLTARPYGVDDFQTHASVQLFAIELDRFSGALLRRIDLFKASDPSPIHALNSYATPTPCSDGKRVVCHFGSLGTACIDIESGNILWRRVFPLEDITGSGASPIIVGSNVILACDGSDQQFIAALTIESGETVWETNRPAIDTTDVSHRRSFSSPIVIEYGGKRQLISMAAQWLVSYEPGTGAELWKARISDGYAAVPSLCFANGLVFACTGFWKHELVAVRVDGLGDVTASHVVWRYGKQVPDVSSPVVVDGLIYFVSSIGIASCLDVEKGELIWQKRLGGNFSASPIACRDRKGDVSVYFTSREGVTTVAKGDRTWVEVAKNSLYGETFASLVADREQLLIRTHPTLYCIGK